MKLPEKFKGIYTEQGQIFDAREAKINEIIDYLTELHEQQKPCEPILSENDLKDFDEASNHDEDCYCDKCKKWHELVGEEI